MVVEVEGEEVCGFNPTPRPTPSVIPRMVRVPVIRAIRRGREGRGMVLMMGGWVRLDLIKAFSL